jgi:hypothetical protein
MTVKGSRYGRWFVALGISALSAVGMQGDAVADGTVNVSSRSLLDVTLEDGNARPSSGEYTVNIRDCRRIITDNPDFVFEWRLRSLNPSSPRFGIKLEQPGVSCNRTSPAREPDDDDCLVLTDDASLTGTNVQQTIGARTFFGITDPADCSVGTQSSRDYRMLMVFTDPRFVEGLATTSEFDFSAIRVILDNRRPATPTVSSVQAGGSSIVVRYEALDDANTTYRALYSTELFDTSGPPEQITGVSRTATTTGSSVRIEGSSIQPNQTYFVSLVAIDRVGNESFASAPQEIVTVPTIDFWEAYQGAGGVEAGGYCSATPGRGAGWWWMVGLALLTTRRGARTEA